MTEKKWYQEGLSFACTSCGKCCSGGPGYVWVNVNEMEAMAEFLGLSLDEFSKKYIRRVGHKFSLIEKSHHDCIFLEEKKCRVYGARPTQCKTFPFWPENLSSKERWEKLKQECEGIDENAPKVSFEKIENERLIQIKRNKNF